MKLRGFVRVFLFGCLAVCGLDAFASGGVNGLPNIIQGGFVYYFPTVKGNAPDGEGNIFGHIQTQVESFKPKAGDTNTIVLARGDTFVVPEGWRFCGFAGYGDADPGIGKLGPNGGLCYTNRNDVALLGVCNNMPVGCVGQGRPQTQDPDWNDKTTIADGQPANMYETCYFERNDGARSKVYVHFVKRNDAYYRIANRGIYYVVRGATLDFYFAEHFARRRWVDEAGTPIEYWNDYTGTNWNFTHKDTLNGAGYETFTINAAPGEDNQANEFHIKAEDDERDLTIRVVDPDTFKFDSYLIFFDGPETRKLSSLLYECLSGYELKDVAKVETIDSTQVSVTSVDGDYELTAHGWYDVDRLVLVTMEDGNVVLLKITTMTGRCDETLCASQPPLIVASKAFTCLIRDDAGKLLRNDSWELTTKTNNTPHGYAYTWRVPNCVLYDGNRYSVYIACKDADVTDPTVAPAGQLKCIRALRKVIV